MEQKEFLEALADLVREKGISEEAFIETLQNALASAYKKQFEGGAEITVTIDVELGSVKFTAKRYVVEEITDKDTQISLEAAKELDAKYEISKTILGSTPVRYKKRKKHFFKVKPMPIPPENAYVYFGENTAVLHLVGECPCLRGAERVYRATYDHARVRDFKREYLSACSWFYKMRHRGSIARLSRLHKPHICRRCGDFRVKQAKGIFYKMGKWIFERMHIDFRRRNYYKA